jgi:hypothetical protein
MIFLNVSQNEQYTNDTILWYELITQNHRPLATTRVTKLAKVKKQNGTGYLPFAKRSESEHFFQKHKNGDSANPLFHRIIHRMIHCYSLLFTVIHYYSQDYSQDCSLLFTIIHTVIHRIIHRIIFGIIHRIIHYCLLLLFIQVVTVIHLLHIGMQFGLVQRDELVQLDHSILLRAQASEDLIGGQFRDLLEAARTFMKT